ncbi:hypothetical protein SAV31267_023640 [Streptomyces avermitilis]|uniref:Uncharacterized protein n=1 Tax=Streptomyces avermitilis TaxID=33903 RepID=A0A4D4MN57_STRAX|nr:hypothetical protein SAV31267_023640 [Streptomyces avermitilis]
MAERAMSVTPYWELTFDADGDVDGRERDRLLAQVAQRKVHDLVVFAHGWNNERSGPPGSTAASSSRSRRSHRGRVSGTWVWCGPR